MNTPQGVEPRRSPGVRRAGYGTGAAATTHRLTLAIVLAATSAVLGARGLMVRHWQFRHGEIAYFLHPDAWGQGYATEVAQRLLHFGFTTLGLHRIIGTCDPRNTASARVLEKVGMQYEGGHRETMLLRDGWRDSLVYSLLEHAWPPSHGERGSYLR